MKLLRLYLFVLLLCTLPLAAQEATPEAVERPSEVVIEFESLYPEGLAYDPIHKRFFVSSTQGSIVHAVDWEGNLTAFIEDERIPASFGLEVDTVHERLLVNISNRANQSFLGIYDLETGENLHFVDLKALNPNSRALTLVNDVAVDAEGNAYITDSSGGIIYKVDIDGNGSAFLEDASFRQAFTLNGIVYYEPGNFLVAVRGRDLIRIPLDNPADFAVIETGESFSGQDGLAFLDEQTLLVSSFSSGNVYRIESDDEFVTGTLTGTTRIGNVSPSNIAIVDGVGYVLHSHLGQRNAGISRFPIQAVVFEEE